MENYFSGKTIPEIFRNQAIKYKSRACVSFKKDGKYIDVSWDDIHGRVMSLASYLLSIKSDENEKIAIFSANRVEWWVADMAILCSSGVNVPVYPTNSAEEAYYILDHSGSSICFVETEAHLEKVLQNRDKLKNLRKIIVFENLKENPDDGLVITLDDAISAGGDNLKEKEINDLIDNIQLESLATIIYTSGTTGDPKGVMLSHNNLLSNVKQLKESFFHVLTEERIFLSFLPLSHVLERTAGYYLPLCCGCRVAFAENFTTVPQNMQEVNPNVLISVPRLYEKIHSTIYSRVGDASLFKRLMFKMAMSTGRKNVPYACSKRPRKGLFALRYKIFDRLIFSKLKKALGMDSLEIAVSGGGPLSISDANFFIGMDISLLEGFGLTETSPVTHVNRDGKIKVGTVGPPLNGTEVRLSDEGELMIKGPQVMMGYYKSETASEEAFTEDGFLKTGDIGIIDHKDYLSITGRIKDIIITAGGKNISPQNIENFLKHSRFIEQVATIGDKRKYLSALIVPAFEELKKWAESENIEFTDMADLIKKPVVVDLFQQEVDTNTTQLSRVEQIKKFTLMDSEWTQETGELTPSLKVKRNVIEEKYKKEIDSMYKE